MRWFRRPNQDNDAPRLISLSPLGLDAQQQQPTESSGWTFNRFSAPAAPLAASADPLAASDAPVPSAHLPCTLKRKPAVRRRSGGKGSSSRWQRHSTADGLCLTGGPADSFARARVVCPPRVNYASRVTLNDEEDDQSAVVDPDWFHRVDKEPMVATSAVDQHPRRFSPIRAFESGAAHRRTASLDNIVDVLGEDTVDSTPNSKSQRKAETCRQRIRTTWCKESPNISPIRSVSCADESPDSGQGLKSKLKNMSDKYLRKNAVVAATGTLTSGLLNRIKAKVSQSPGSHLPAENRSSFRSFSCATLPALDEFQRRKLMDTSASMGADNDSGIVQEWSDTSSSIPDSPYIRHYQPCQMLSSWRCRPQPKVRRSLSPIFQRVDIRPEIRPEGSDDEEEEESPPTPTPVAESSVSVAPYETLWTSTTIEPEATVSIEAPPAAEEDTHPEEEDKPPEARYTMRIHVQYPCPEVSDTPPSGAHYQTASLDRRHLRAARVDGGAPSGEEPTSVHLLKIERDPEHLTAELGIFIAKKKLTRGNVGYVVAHIVPGGIVDRDGRLKLGDEIVNVNGRRLRNLSMSQASAVLRLPVPVVELVVNRKSAPTGGPSERSKRFSVDDMLNENAATIILVNTGDKADDDDVIDGNSQSGHYENVEVAMPRLESPSHHLDDSGVEISESSSCSSSDSHSVPDVETSSDLLIVRRPYHRHKRSSSQERLPLAVYHSSSSSSTTSDQPSDETRPSSSSSTSSTGHKMAGEFCTLPRRPLIRPTTQSFYTVVYEKGLGKKSLGFTLVGGKDSPKGPMGFYVKTIMAAGQAAEEGSLAEGDEIVAINGRLLDGLRHAEAIGIFKSIKSGSVTLQVCRRHKKDQRKSKSRSCEDLLKDAETDRVRS